VMDRIVCEEFRAERERAMGGDDMMAAIVCKQGRVSRLGSTKQANTLAGDTLAEVSERCCEVTRELRRYQVKIRDVGCC
jgi:hypothetical protein